MSVDEVAQKTKQALGKLPTLPLAQAGQLLSDAIEALRPIASESTDPELHQAHAQFEEADREIARILGICHRVHELVGGYLDRLGAEAAPATGSGSPAVRTDDTAPPKNRVDRLRDELPPPVRRKSGSKTHGRWFTPNGEEQQVVSGEDELTDLANQYLVEAGVRRVPAAVSTHVETKLAARMRHEGIEHAEVVINNLPCPGPFGCDRLVPMVLPEGSSLTVHGTAEDGSTYRKRYTGKARRS
ncbi:DddA-like double-stranded DNA deaminase toxin [Saccharopolyspora taberi]|uniref:SCP1.201-like deaminase n=1 Tax=Saccharopolyspora taberi TaxID=60895 RepID=A0ABN3V1G5_9PSEU